MNKNKNAYGLIALLALTAVTAFFLFRKHELGAVLDALKKASPAYLAAGLFLMFLFNASEGLRIWALLRSLGYRPGLMACLKYAFLGFYFSSITPSATGGQPAQVFYMSKDGIGFGDASLCITAITVSYQIGTLLICFFAFVMRRSFVAANLGAVKYLVLSGYAGNCMLLFVILESASHIGFLKKLFHGAIRGLAKVKIVKDAGRAQAGVDAQLEKYADGGNRLFKKPGVLLVILGLTLIQILSRLFVTVVVYRSFHLQGYGFVDILALEALLALGVGFTPMPGAVGVAEAGFLMVNQAIFGAEYLAPALLLTRGISFYVWIVVSGVVSLYAHLSLTRKGAMPELSPIGRRIRGVDAGPKRP
ncbi:MAG TPA: lysylphosphatidylglycerol synthase transmembrane domain-containing protein [Candidatus Acidoferrum sp.]|nr:lysylphosphatidylglycerol synthase transmembrane domain-containing protein [Candidatus Acidoferrum sp.]